MPEQIQYATKYISTDDEGYIETPLQLENPKYKESDILSNTRIWPYWADPDKPISTAYYLPVSTLTRARDARGMASDQTLVWCFSIDNLKSECAKPKSTPIPLSIRTSRYIYSLSPVIMLLFN